MSRSCSLDQSRQRSGHRPCQTQSPPQNRPEISDIYDTISHISN